MQKTKIEWVRNPDGSQGYSWNPIKGLCPVGCCYCYAKGFYQRFKIGTKTPWLDHGEFGQGKAKKAKGIFACSTFELFHPITQKTKPSHGMSWRDVIFYAIEHTPQHRFYILTKMPENIDRPMPDNVWLGISTTNTKEYENMTYHLPKIKATVKFLSLEPLFEDINKFAQQDYFAYLAHYADWIIIGRLTGYGKKYDPKREWIEDLMETSKMYNFPIFLKDNLKDIWGEDLIQEFPE